MFDGFKIKIPSEFKIMSDEIINIKYPNGNAPSLVYTNDKTTINVVLVMNDVTMKNNQIEEYVKTMESTYKNYSKDVKLKFWERNNHKIGKWNLQQRDQIQKSIIILLHFLLIKIKIS